MTRPFVLVRDREGKNEERVNFADLYNTWNRNFELSNTYQVSFTMRYIPGFENVFNLARPQAEVLFGGQSYKIKELEAVANENGLVTKKVTAQNALIDRLKNIIIADQDDSSQRSSDDSSDDDNQQPGTTVTKKTGIEQTYSLDQVMHMFTDNNDQNVHYELHGNFPQLPVKASGSLYSFLTSSLVQFGAYWIPDGNTVKIYDLPSLTHKTGETFRYLYDTPNVDIQSSTMDMVNSVQVQAGKMEETTTSGGNVSKNAQGLIDYAKSWLGRPYILGGRTEAGSDCAGFVHFCYQAMGIDVGWTTWELEPSFHTVSSPQTGDVGFYGVPGNPYHVCLFLDPNTIIFEPQPGQVCKMEPASWFYPSWIGRNDQMAAIVNGGSRDAGDSSTSKEYYQLNYTYTDDDSKNTYDLHRGDMQTLDSIYDQNAANTYLSTHLQTDPAASMTFSHKGKCDYSLGDSIYTIAPELNIATDMVIFSISTNDFNDNADATVNFNSTGKAMQDVNKALLDKIRNVANRPTYLTAGRDTGGRYEDHFRGVTVVGADEMAKAKKLTETGAV